jgi:predicted enzyme related to lactoylglutathione lyase
VPIRRHYPRGTACWLAYGAKDPVAAAGFYLDLFSWQLVTEPGGGGHQALLGAHPAASFARTPGQPAWLVCLAGNVDAPPTGWTTRIGPLPLGDIGRLLIAADDQGASVGIFSAGRTDGIVVAHEPGASYGAWRLGAGAPASAQSAVAGCGGTVSDRVEIAGVLRLGLDSVEALWAVDDGSAPRWLPAFGTQRYEESLTRVSAAGGTVIRTYREAAEVSDPLGAPFVVLGS